MPKLSEADICAKLITPALNRARWGEAEQIYREYTLRPGRVVVRGQKASRDKRSVLRADYVLFYKTSIPLAVIEAKDNTHAVGAGMAQAITYAALLDVPFAFSSNGDGFVFRDATLASGAHYIDLSDGRDFVAGFGAAIDVAAKQANRLAVTGASTLPALSSAVIDNLAPQFATIRSIDTIIAPAQSAARGTATLAGALSYAGKPFSGWEQGTWRARHGWQDVRRVDAGPVGKRLSAVCDVPDLVLFPVRYPGVEDVRFRAALDVGVQHLAIALLAALRRAGLNISIDKLAPHLDRIATWFDRFGSDVGGMTVTLAGTASNGQPLRLRWHVRAPGRDGPEIPCMAAILLARKLAAGTIGHVGAMPYVGLIPLFDFTPEFAKWGMTTAVEELH